MLNNATAVVLLLSFTFFYYLLLTFHSPPGCQALTQPAESRKPKPFSTYICGRNSNHWTMALEPAAERSKFQWDKDPWTVGLSLPQFFWMALIPFKVSSESWTVTDLSPTGDTLRGMMLAMQQSTGSTKAWAWHGRQGGKGFLCFWSCNPSINHPCNVMISYCLKMIWLVDWLAPHFQRN